MLITGSGDDRREFDPFLMLAAISENHPMAREVVSVSAAKRAMLALVALAKFEFREDVFDSVPCKVMALPEEILNSRFEIWYDFDSTYTFRVTAPDAAEPFEILIQTEIDSSSRTSMDTAPEKIISVARKELNTAIYRGAIRTGGILLDREIEPNIDGEEKILGQGPIDL